MDILFLSHIPEDDSNGVWKKINSQVKSLRNLGHSVYLTYFKDKDTLTVECNGRMIFEKKILHRYFWFFYLENKIKIKFDFIYVRKPHGGLYPLGMSFFLRKFKKCEVVMEIPTYPFKNETTGVLGKISSLIFDTEMLLSKRYIDKFIVIGEDVKEIYGKECINIINGVNVEDVPFLGNIKNDRTSIIFLGVANLSFWHGYDRLIDSIKNYHGDRNIKFLIVGDTEPEYSRLKSLSQSYSLKNIEFLGKLNSKQISELMIRTDICVDSLGRHRSGNNINSSIKSKEYTAMGIPFIMSHDDPAFGNDRDLNFIFKCLPNESPISMIEIINWYDNLKVETPKNERDYAVKNFTWDSIFNKIIKRG